MTRQKDTKHTLIDKELLTHRRESKGLGKTDFAQKAGLDLRALRRLEVHGLAMPREIPRICELLEIDPRKFVLHKDPPASAASPKTEYTWEDLMDGADEIARLAIREWGADAILTFSGTSLVFVGLVLATLPPGDTVRARVYTAIFLDGKVSTPRKGFAHAIADQFTIVVPEVVIRDPSKKIVVIDDYIASGGAMEALRKFFKDKRFDPNNIRFACCICYDGLQTRPSLQAKMPDFVGIKQYQDHRLFKMPWKKDSITFEEALGKPPTLWERPVKASTGSNE